MINYSIFIKFKPKKRYLALGIILLTAAKCAYSISTEDERYLEHLDNPPLITQKWPKIDGKFVTLSYPASYLDSNILVIEPYLNKRKDKNEKTEQAKICEEYTCAELLQVLLPKLEPRNRSNLKFFRSEFNSKDDKYFFENYVRILINTNYFSKNVKNYVPLNTSFILGINSAFHFRRAYEDIIAKNIDYNDIIAKSETRKIDNVDLVQILDVNNDLMGGKKKNVIFSDKVKSDYENKVADPFVYKFFYTLNNGKLTRVILCTSVQDNISSREETLKLYINPVKFNCSHKFVIDELNLDVSISYSGKNVVNAIHIENSIRKLIFGFVKEK